jgi:ribosomal protein S27AE
MSEPMMAEIQISNWKPPQGFIALESKLPGVTVYAPAPIEDQTPDRQDFLCPRCGASTAYSPDAGSVTCSHCGYLQENHAVVVGDSAEESEFTLNTLRSQIRGWGKDRRELHCQSCGADISLAPNDLSASCSFCGSNQVINRVPSQEGLRPNFLIPFKFNLTDCQLKAQEWLGRGWMHPTDLSSAATSVQFKGMYLPYWTFSASISADWKAEVGYERTESYYDSASHTTHTRTVIDWRWEDGRIGLPVENMMVTGTQSASALLLDKVSPFPLGDLVAYNPEFLAGWQAKSYDIPLQPAWETGKSRMREMAKDACMQDIPTSHVRNFAMSADFADETWRLILVPVYLSAYRFQEKSYQVLVNGQTGMVAGQKPVAWWKVWLAILALLLPGTILGLIGLPLLALGGAGVLPLGIGVILFIIGLVISGIIIRRAMQSGEA